MKIVKDFLNIIFNAIMILLGFIVIVEIGTSIFKNIKVSSKIKNNDICLYVNNELYCRLDYNITFEYKTNEA